MKPQYDLILTDKNHHILCSLVPKVATTTITEMLTIHSGLLPPEADFLNLDTSPLVVEKYGLVRLHRMSRAERDRAIDDYFSFTFGRHPFERYTLILLQWTIELG